MGGTIKMSNDVVEQLTHFYIFSDESFRLEYEPTKVENERQTLEIKIQLPLFLFTLGLQIKFLLFIKGPCILYSLIHFI